VLKGHRHRPAIWRLGDLTLVDARTLLSPKAPCAVVVDAAERTLAPVRILGSSVTTDSAQPFSSTLVACTARGRITDADERLILLIPDPAPPSQAPGDRVRTDVARRAARARQSPAAMREVSSRWYRRLAVSACVICRFPTLLPHLDTHA
jgi:hypothetical protein